MSEPFATVATELPRDRWGRPLITPPEGGEPVAYQRVTTFVGALEDTYHLGQWQKRMVALGMARTKSLQLAASAITDPKDRSQKKTLNNIAEDALKMANGSAAADTGTALHSFTEIIDKGQPLQYVPEEYEADLTAYREVMEPFSIVDIEGFCVRDDLRVGGSYDRILGLPEEGILGPAWWRDLPTSPADGLVRGAVIGDLKTGGNHADGLFGMGKICMQLGTYANSKSYDHSIGARRDLPGDPRTDLGIVVHLPAGSGRAQLLWVNIADGWSTAYNLAPAVHAWRKRKDLSSPFRSASATTRTLTIPEQIHAATAVEQLYAVHAANSLVWTPGLTALAAQRKKELEVKAA